MKRLGMIGIFSIVAVMVILVLGCGVKEGEVSGVTTLRSEYKTLDESEARAALKRLNMFDRRWNKHHSFPNKFEEKEVNGDKIVIDHATNLVWHQSGSESQLSHEEAENWLKNLNRKGYAGYKSWRFPTIEEAASLIEGNRVKKRNIDPLFSYEHYSTHTGDIYSPSRFWGVSYHYGGLFRIGQIEPSYIKPVTKYRNQ